MTNRVLLRADGSPVSPNEIARIRQSAPQRARPRAALSGDYKWAFPYDASSWYANETQGWFPYTYSPDYEINVYRDRMVGRVRDLVRNDGWASGSIMRMLDATIGGHYRLVAQPDYRALARRSGNPKYDAVWAADYRQAVEAEWRGWAEGSTFFCDSTRQMTFSQLAYLALRHKLVDGEPLAALELHPDRVGYGAARYATALHLIDPDRLSNPHEMIDTKHWRGGVQVDDHGAPVGYHIRRAHQLDWYNAVESMEWDYFPREDEDGRPFIIHDLDRDRVDQHRGLGVFVPVLNRLKMLARFDSAEMQAAVINSIFAVAFTSPYDPEGTRELMDQGESADLGYYETLRQDWRRGHPVTMENAQVFPVFPGEEPKPIAPTHPGPQYDPFSHAVLRHIAAQTGQTAEDISQDWSKVNYSSARAAMLTAARTTRRRVIHFNSGFCNRVYMGWLQEAHEIADLPMPQGGELIDYVEARESFARCRWLGPGRGWVDPVKEAQGATLRMDNMLGTLENECAEQGLDYEEVIPQRAYERRLMEENGVPFPAAFVGAPAQEDERKPVLE